MSDTFENDTNTEVKYGSLKTLTVLTFIGCGLGYLGSCWNFFKADKSVADFETAMNNPDLPDFAKKMMTPEALENLRLMAANKLPIFLLTLVGVTLCLVGALQMRKLKAQGYYLWLLGEVLPLIGTAIFIGAGALFSGFNVVGPIIVLLFIVLYTLQRKYLINK